MSETGFSQLSSFLGESAWVRLAERLKLSPRELDIVQGVLRDEKELAIALGLSISQHTVHTHLERLRNKLGVRSRAELVVIILTTFLLMTAEPHGSSPPTCLGRATGRCPLRG